MPSRASHLLARARDSFWFVPGVFVASAILLAELVVTVDRVAPVPDWTGGVILEVGADGSRGLLTAIAASMLGAAATMFSITIAVLALTSSNYGPRLVRNFMADRGNQVVLGGLVSIALYALLVVRHIRVLGEESDAFVPHLAVNLAVLLLIVGIGLLVYFIHHIASDIQVSNLSTSVRRQLIRRIDEQFPLDAEAEVASIDEWSVVSAAPVFARGNGYVGGIAIDNLVATAHQHDLRIDVVVQPGSYVVEGDRLADVSLISADDVDETRDRKVADAVAGSIGLESERTPYQDLEHLVRQLVDLAVRALSPGTNDPFTAINALDDLSAALAHGISRPDPPRVLLDGDGVARVRVIRRRIVSLATDALDVVRPYLPLHTVVTCRALLCVKRLVMRAHSDEDRAELLAAADRIVDDVVASATSLFDQERIRAARAACDFQELSR